MRNQVFIQTKLMSEAYRDSSYNSRNGSLARLSLSNSSRTHLSRDPNLGRYDNELGVIEE